MRVAEYKQVSTELVERTRYIENEDGTITEESYTEEVPVMELVYRDETESERIERERLEAELPTPIPSTDDRIEAIEEAIIELAEMVVMNNG